MKSVAVCAMAGALAGCSGPVGVGSLQPSQEQGGTKGWTSGGSIVVEDSGNPWFLTNTKVVRYCVVWDPATFSAISDRLDGLVRQALDYWKAQFLAARYREPTPLAVATQDFIEQPSCDADTDLTLQFGVLTELQRRYLRDPRGYIAVSVRTAYDTERLQGKGFIYLSPDNGPQRYRGDFLVDSAWSSGNGGLLEKVLMHELGHVFGLPHSGRGPADLMAADFANEILRRDRLPHFERVETRPDFFHFRSGHYVDCALGNAANAKTFFGLAKDWQCLGFHIARNVEPGDTIEVSGKAGEREPWQGLGKIEVRNAWRDQQALIQVWMPAEQKIFAVPLETYLPAGPSLESISIVGRYRAKGSHALGPFAGSTTVHVSLSPSHYRFETLTPSPALAFRIDDAFPFVSGFIPDDGP